MRQKIQKESYLFVLNQVVNNIIICRRQPPIAFTNDRQIGCALTDKANTEHFIKNSW